MTPFRPFSLNIGGRLVEFARPAVMGILNATDDSFYAASRVAQSKLGECAEAMIARGADMLDLGAYSSRPGAAEVDEDIEIRRLTEGVRAIRSAVGNDVPLSVDTFRASAARAAIEAGADIVNDISGGDLDADMFATVAELRVPYILMHMRGTPATMQSLTDYTDVTTEVIDDLSRKLERLHALGVADVIIDPGFGFAKTLEQNYRMLAELDRFALLGCPVLAGMSRKSMLTRLLGITADEALAATAVVGALALERGASILRVHDPREAAQSIAIVNALNTTQPCSI